MAAHGTDGTNDIRRSRAGCEPFAAHRRTERGVRGALLQDASESDGMLAFLARLSRFGLGAEGPPLLKPARGGN